MSTERYDYRVRSKDCFEIEGSCHVSGPREATDLALRNYVQTAEDLDLDFNPFYVQIIITKGRIGKDLPCHIVKRVP